MTKDEIQKIREGLLDSELGKSRDEALAILDAALATPAQAAPVRSDLIDDDGENKAVRAFLSLYQNGATSVRKMVVHMAHLGWGNNPTWVTEALDEPLTKAGAQLWIRHLLALENAPAAPDTCPDCGKPAPEGSIHTCSPQKPDSWDAVIDNMMGVKDDIQKT